MFIVNSASVKAIEAVKRSVVGGEERMNRGSTVGVVPYGTVMADTRHHAFGKTHGTVQHKE